MIKCGLLDHEHSTVVFDQWRGHTNDTNKPYRLFMPSVPIYESPHPDNDAFPVSEAVIANASAFKQSFTADKKFMAVHIRTGRLATQNGERAKECVSQLFQLIANLTSSNSHLSCFYFVDYGPYGTHKGEQNVARPVISQLETVRHIAPTHYDPSKFNGLNNAGFVSLVEKYAIAHAKVLVLAGGGTYQCELGQSSRSYQKTVRCTQFATIEKLLTDASYSVSFSLIENSSPMQDESRLSIFTHVPKACACTCTYVANVIGEKLCFRGISLWITTCTW